ncbi:MAG TPA: YfcE family phosphodiesterase [Gemmatimonadaceae bacterium]|nr:YfcE family phosphodiesterase [Gemmatimonadaceae bacterium]
MLVGLMADSHDRVPAIRSLLQRITELGAGMVLHAGDYCSPFSLQPFLELSIPFVGVHGRNDGDREGLKAFASKGVGIELFESPHSLEVGGRRILLVHDLGEVADRSLESHEIIVNGFTHKQEMRELPGGAIIVNPGEACGWLYAVPSAAILDLETKQVDFISLTESAWKV